MKKKLSVEFDYVKVVVLEGALKSLNRTTEVMTFDTFDALADFIVEKAALLSRGGSVNENGELVVEKWQVSTITNVYDKNNTVEEEKTTA